MDIEVMFNRPDRPIVIDDLVRDLHIAQYRLVVASAWFTDITVAQAIIDSRAETKIVILNRSDIQRGEKEAYRRVFQNPYLKSGRHGSGLYILGGASWEQGVMHHKFCLMDYRTVWTGSYNYTMQARRNYETLLRIDSMAVNDEFWDEAMHLIEDVPYVDDQTDAPVDSDFCAKCRRPVTPDEVCGWNSSGDVWCDKCMDGGDENF
jgi:phosphatidylserine/phosphatidylglycerophosphate/cardiolipin synthase-like enzyme